jgi:hypothetical protein
MLSAITRDLVDGFSRTADKLIWRLGLDPRDVITAFVATAVLATKVTCRVSKEEFIKATTETINFIWDEDDKAQAAKKVANN